MRPTLKTLASADPALAQKLRTALNQAGLDEDALVPMNIVEDILWGMAQEVGFGKAIGNGYAALIRSVGSDELHVYQAHLRRGGEQGPTMGTIFARHLVPVLLSGDRRIRDQFLKTVDVMCTKGSYTLNRPLEWLDELLAAKDLRTAYAFLGLLARLYHHPMTYADSLHFSNRLPEVLRQWNASRRWWQIDVLADLGAKDLKLVDPFIRGMQEGLALLSPSALRRFAADGWKQFSRHPETGTAFLSLASLTAREHYAAKQVAVALAQIGPRLNRYLSARLEVPATVRPLSQLSPPVPIAEHAHPHVCSDGRFIYLPDEIGCFDTKSANIGLYQCLTRLEAACFEFGTYVFDLEKFTAQGAMPQSGWIPVPAGQSDWHLFGQAFAEPELAIDLAHIYEHGRLMHLMSKHYPGLVRKAKPILREAWQAQYGPSSRVDPISALYGWVVLDQKPASQLSAPTQWHSQLRSFLEQFRHALKTRSTAESSAAMVVSTYEALAALWFSDPAARSVERAYHPLAIPFGWRMRPDLWANTEQAYEKLIRAIRSRLAAHGLISYRSDLRMCLGRSQGKITLKDLRKIVHPIPDVSSAPTALSSKKADDFKWLNLSQLLQGDRTTGLTMEGSEAPVYWYPEWDVGLNEYRIRHVRVSAPWVKGRAKGLYQRVLQRHHGLIRQVRRAFEMLRPQGLVILRPWIEGDAFDYRALLDFAIDQKAGLMPSERLYIKRVKQARDVAVLLLVDLSRSTAQVVRNRSATVLDIEKEAIVLLCEALEVVGDRYAIAGFSGSGRLGVEYQRVKEFEQALDNSTQKRIGAMQSQRSTRMGAAIRHATRHLEQVPAKVNLLIILSDGFPNDLDYKQDYAISDTRKAITEARARRIFVKAITVNSVGDPQLDALYGNLHHTVISDVRELPTKLLQIYGALTRM